MKKLLALEKRIERLARGPEGIDAPFVRLMRPILKRLGYTPRVSATAAQLLLRALAARLDRDGPPSMLDESGLLVRAVLELEENVAGVETITVIRKKPLVAYAAWLRRLFEVLVHASRFVAGEDGFETHGEIAAARAPLVLPPLTVIANEETSPAKPKRVFDHQPTRLLELDLAAIDHVLAEATSGSEVLGRRRRLLETARQLLLDVSAALPLDEHGVEERRRHITGEITRIDRLVAAGISPEATLTHQLREAMARGERQRLHAILVAQHGVALRSGNEVALRSSQEAIKRLWGANGDPRDGSARQRSLARSAEQLFGSAFVERSKAIYATENARAAKLLQSTKNEDITRGHSMASYFAEGSVRGLLAAQVAVDGSFEVGGTLLPMRIEEVEKRYRAVRFPTNELLLLPAIEPNDIPDAAVDDPRTILLDLAAGRLLARRFILEEKTIRHRTVMRGEARVYVLDGSGSMIGPRARMRDAIVASELLTLQRRYRDGAKFTRVTFFYRYFDTVVHPMIRVDDPRAINVAMTDVLGTLREGGTDIETALVSSLRVVAAAQGTDPDLARAQVVLVTDGEAAISEENITRARREIGIPVGFSVIALGQQNDTLRRLVASQRARGERAFYHFIPDSALMAACAGRIDDGLAIHLRGKDIVDPIELQRELGTVVDDIVQLGRNQEVAALESLDDESAANFEIGVDEGSFTEGERARARALYRDRRALERQFFRWFPRLDGAQPTPPIATPPPDADVEATLVVLASVIDVVAVVQGTELARRADAIAILERLLPDADLTPARYFAVMSVPPKPVAAALAAVHAATSPPK
ncbi:hypothetical protein BH09MYX1_BH09MYX1_02790 [soil metagenome]